jgi:hypothetical protein
VARQAPHVRVRFAVPLLLAIAALALLALPSPAQAGGITKRDRGGVSKKVAKRFHLNKKERRALDVASVQVTGRNNLGVVVDVRFKGNVERLVGRGHLKRAAIALVLEPRSRRVNSAVIVNQGPARSQRVRRRTQSTRAGAIRSGRTVKFFIQGGGFGGVRGVKVRALPRAPRPAKNAIAAGEPNDGIEEMTDAEAEEIDVGVVAADAFFTILAANRIDPDELTCDELEDLGDDIEEALDRARAIDDALADAEEALEEELQQAEGMDRPLLEEALRQVRGTRLLLAAAADTLADLLREVDDIIEEECGPTPRDVFVLVAIMTFVHFGPGEVRANDAYFERRLMMPAPAQTTSPITAIRIVLPPDGSTNRQVTNYLCPNQLPVAAVETTNAPNDTLVCSGGSLALEERFSVNIRMNPPPTNGMGGQLFGQQDGSFKGPFAVTGP